MTLETALEAAEILKKMTVFSVNDASKVLKKTPTYTKIYLGRLARKGIIKRIAKNKYTLHHDPQLIATGIYTPAYLSLTTALRFHDMTTQLPTDIHVTTPKKKGTIELEGTRIIFHTEKNHWGYKRYEYHEMRIPVSDPEKTLIDCALKPIPTHLLYEALTLKKTNKERLITYLKRAGNKTATKRIGYLLEKTGTDIHQKVEKMIDHNYTRLEPKGPAHGTKNKKWKIIENLVME